MHLNSSSILPSQFSYILSLRLDSTHYNSTNVQFFAVSIVCLYVPLPGGSVPIQHCCVNGSSIIEGFSKNLLD